MIVVVGECIGKQQKVRRDQRSGNHDLPLTQPGDLSNKCILALSSLMQGGNANRHSDDLQLSGGVGRGGGVGTNESFHFILTAHICSRLNIGGCLSAIGKSRDQCH